MVKISGYLLSVILFPQFLMSDTLSNAVCSDILTEFRNCFSGERSPDHNPVILAKNSDQVY
jgi:hypothetical protein